jgi:GntR family transcriptional repressor for pyruvate dehydrogenase complex
VSVTEQNSAARLHQQCTSTVLGEIAAGRYRPGERLPTEMDLAHELEVSRGVVRELLRRLEDRGVISIQHGRGARVQPISSWNVLDAEVLHALMPTRASITLLTHYLECRRILETEAAALAAMRASSKDLTDMADSFARMTECAEATSAGLDDDSEASFHEADIAFHGAIFRASGNQVLPQVVEPIQRAMGTLRPQLALHPEHRIRKTLPEHKAILAAIADHDPDRARKAMSDHLATVEGYLREYAVRRGGEVSAEA